MVPTFQLYLRFVFLALDILTTVRRGTLSRWSFDRRYPREAPISSHPPPGRLLLPSPPLSLDVSHFAPTGPRLKPDRTQKTITLSGLLGHSPFPSLKIVGAPNNLFRENSREIIVGEMVINPKSRSW